MTKYIVFSLVCYFILMSVDLYAENDIYGKWARKTGLISSDFKSNISVENMIVDNSGNIYVSGNAYGVVDFTDDTCNPTKIVGYKGEGRYKEYIYPPRSGIIIEGINLRKDGWVSKFDNTGKWKWTIRVSSDVLDNCPYLCLSSDGKTLVFTGTFAYVHDEAEEGLTGIPTITYGNGISEKLPITTNDGLTTTVPGAWGNVVLVGVNTSDGSKRFLIDKGPAGTSPRRFGVGGIYSGGQFFFFQSFRVKGSDYYMSTMRYDFNGVPDIGSEKEHKISNTSPVGAVAISKNNAGEYAYTMARIGKYIDIGGKRTWHYDINLLITSLSNLETGTYSRVSSTQQEEFNTNEAHLHGIIAQGIDLNAENTHLFLVGFTKYEFDYVGRGGLGNVKNKGGYDGAIVCYDTSKSDDQVGHIRWSILLQNTGEQTVMDCVYDNNAKLLHVVGYIDENEVNFNPNGVAMPRKAKSGIAAYYASYDLHGICKNITIIDADSKGDDKALAIAQPSENEIVVFGTFSSSPFPIDPTGKVIPLRSTEKSNFIACYSLDGQEPDIPLAASYSSADKIHETYGIARHSIQSCLKIGEVNTEVDINHEFFPRFYQGGTANNNYDGYSKIDIGTGTLANGITVTVKTLNSKESSAFLAGWIDFNENGMFDINEISKTITIPGGITDPTEYKLEWTLPAGVNPQLNTFMRIRLTSENIDGTWAAGDAADGEVEDYYLKFNFSVPVNPHIRISAISP